MKIVYITSGEIKHFFNRRNIAMYCTTLIIWDIE